MDSSSVWTSAFDYAHTIEREQGDGLSVDQRIELAGVMALLAIGQELSAFNPANTTRFAEDGKTLNGWGMPVPD